MEMADARATLVDLSDASAPNGLTVTMTRSQVEEALSSLQSSLDDLGRRRAEELLSAHRRVRSAAHQTGRPSVEVKLPLDVIGTYVLMPAPLGGR